MLQCLFLLEELQRSIVLGSFSGSLYVLSKDAHIDDALVRVEEKFKASSWGKKLTKQANAKSMTDFDRFK
eukprot:1160428-Pelagomonas_calceolata.AAC.19